LIEFGTQLPIVGRSGVDRLPAGEAPHLSGSGPYRIDELRAERMIVLARRIDWWGSDLVRHRGMYGFDEIRLVFVSTEDLLLRRLWNDELDVVQVMGAKPWHTETEPDRVRRGWIVRQSVFTDAPRGFSGLVFNLRRPPFDDLRVRRAFALLFDRSKLVDKILFGEYTPSHSFFPNTPCENLDNPKVGYDPAAAVRLLEEAGWRQSSREADGWLAKNGERFAVELMCTSRSTLRVFSIVRQDLARVGIDLVLREVTPAAEAVRVGSGQFVLAYRSTIGTPFPSLAPFESNQADVEGGENLWGLVDPRLDELSRREKRAPDRAASRVIVREADGLLSRAQICAFGWHARHNRLLRWNRFGTPPFVLSRYEDFPSIVRYWWRDARKDRALERAMERAESLPAEPPAVRYWDDRSRASPARRPAR
jgi:microcin C transport system substrate-binding protein